MTIVDISAVQGVPADIEGETPSERDVLAAAASVGADAVVFVETPQISEEWAKGSSSKWSASASSGTLYSTSVVVRSVRVESGELLWNGAARYGRPLSGLDDVLTKLAGQALATAWGYRPPGQLRISSQSMCEIED